MQEIIDRIIKIVDTDELLISYIPGTTDNVLIIFSGHSVTHEAFLADAVRDDTYIFIADRLFQWGNAFDVEFILSHINPIIANKNVSCMGMSMGGFLAIIFSSILNAKSCLAFVPQYSPFKKYLGHSYWGEAGIKTKHSFFKAVRFNDQTDYTILTTNQDIDAPHSKKIMTSKLDNVLVYVLDSSKGFTHNHISYKLKDLGMLDKIIQSIVKNGKIVLSVESLFSSYVHLISRGGNIVYSSVT